MSSNHPFCLVDIGARGGIHPRWAKFKDSVINIQFEPDEAEAVRLSRSGSGLVIPAALGDTERQTTFYICQDTSCSSCLKPNEALLAYYPEPERFAITSEATINLSTLDNELCEKRGIAADFIKVDVQGFELQVLKGAEESLSSCIGVELEVNFAELYRDGASFGEIDAFLRAAGFALFDLRRFYWRRNVSATYSQVKGQLMFGDAVYFRSPENLISQSLPEEMLVHGILAYVAYGYFDAASMVAARISVDSPFAAFVTQLMGELKKPIFPSGIPYFRGQSRVHDLVLRFCDYLSPGNWRSGYDKRLGNLFVD